MDILLQDRGDGAEVILEGGDLKGDGTLYNAVYLSLLSGDNFSNAFEKYETNGDFEASLNNPITRSNLQDTENKASSALKWMLDEGVADSIDIYAHGNDDNQIQVDVTVTEPTGNVYKFAVAWENQRKVLKVL